MERELYESTQMQIIQIARLVKDLPLGEFIGAIDTADSIGPVVDPTLWMRGHEKMDMIRKAAVALNKFQLESEALFPKED